ncbi:MAG TPA: protease SohB [Gammaproteobacteria bacterium]|nr:protease SohB [Gammaproteobacteria bacterium]
MEFLADYGTFLAKFLTVVIILVIIAGAALIIIMKSKAGVDGHLNITNINQRFDDMKLVLQSQILQKSEFKKLLKEYKQKHKKGTKKSGDEESRKRIYVIDFKGDIRASEVSSLREEITAILTITRPQDEVLARVESAGGTVHGYGLAASQLKRIRDRKISLTVAVDKVAASGGYMMACVGSRIIAAPFAIIGSVGVLAQIPNFNRLLEKHDIDFEQFAAGKYKRTLSLFGKNTDEQRQKMQEELRETHELFKVFIRENRGQVDIDAIATGEHWYGTQALELKLVDKLQTSDDYLCEASDNADIYEIDYVRKKSLPEKFFSVGTRLLDQVRYSE